MTPARGTENINQIFVSQINKHLPKENFRDHAVENGSEIVSDRLYVLNWCDSVKLSHHTVNGKSPMQPVNIQYC